MKPPRPPKTKEIKTRELSEIELRSWSAATQDVRPLKGKRKLPPAPETAEELRKKPIRAKTPIIRVAARSTYDGKLDLHGLTESGAHQLLMEFLKNEINHGSKKLLIITGKGSGLGGVLRANVPRWMDVEPFASHIRSIEIAPPNLGGDGAYLVTMKSAKRKF